MTTNDVTTEVEHWLDNGQPSSEWTVKANAKAAWITKESADVGGTSREWAVTGYVLETDNDSPDQVFATKEYGTARKALAAAKAAAVAYVTSQD